MTKWFQYQIQLKARSRGIHLVSHEVLNELTDLPQIDVGLLHLFICHTSAGLSINENADPTVRQDLNAWLNHTVAENTPYFKHTYEGPDDMPAHVKSSLMGVELTIPVKNGQLALGTWQGIYLCEFRDYGGARNIVATLQGKSHT